VQGISHSNMRLRNGLHELNQIVLPIPRVPIIRMLTPTPPVPFDLSTSIAEKR